MIRRLRGIDNRQLPKPRALQDGMTGLGLGAMGEAEAAGRATKAADVAGAIRTVSIDKCPIAFMLQ